ncbi:arabinan endo-1,5-alpha-L-arabinosidase [Demequina sp. NBRC 110054]|uniref:arabinan endo-1,5-alpha-L-arabinosidase n=1 Tax=Demequina sp. NBRC 110054 TaxID=1570343 RepID=UPI001F273C99|nr:arabinan endo-1,5-alpha-L-arabinosidase [Demequina sp. NBRC 110054]
MTDKPANEDHMNAQDHQDAPNVEDAPAPSKSRKGLIVGGIAAAIVVVLAVGTLVWAPWSGAKATALDISGDIYIHDPAIVAGIDDGEGDWYVYGTGDAAIGAGSPRIFRSQDEGSTWEEVGTAWDTDTRPSWVYSIVPTVGNFWAPELYEHDGTWYLYYSASTFGSNRSVIGLMTSPTLDIDDPDYGWTDQGQVWASDPNLNNYNAIDPGIIEDEDGTPWMAFGSFWGGIQMIELEWPSGLAADDAEPVTIATRNDALDAIEAPYIVEHDGYYYLFVSRDSCCQGLDSTYNIAVGRSESVTGPYVDSLGNDMLYNGGESLLVTDGDMIGPGGQSYSNGYLAFHYYDGANNGQFRLEIRELAWTDDGWPVAWTAGEPSS